MPVGDVQMCIGAQFKPFHAPRKHHSFSSNGDLSAFTPMSTTHTLSHILIHLQTHRHTPSHTFTVTHTISYTHKHTQSHTHIFTAHTLTPTIPHLPPLSHPHTPTCADAQVTRLCLCWPLLWTRVCPGGQVGSIQLAAVGNSARVSFHSGLPPWPVLLALCRHPRKAWVMGIGVWRWPCPCVGLRAALLPASGWTSHHGAGSGPGGR